MDLSLFPTLNAMLNATSAVLLTAGYLLIRQGRRQAHRWVMTAAFVVSTLFLASYLFYHAQHGSTRFTGSGWIRPVYFGILLSHTILAAVAAPLAVMTFWRGLKGNYLKHRRVARWTWPIWLYVSVTGIVVYWLLYHS